MHQTSRTLSLLLALQCFALLAAADGFFDIELSNGKYGILFSEGFNKKEKWIVKAEYDSITDQSAYLNPWRKDDKDLTRFFYLMYRNGKMGIFRHGTQGIRDWDYVLKCQYEKVVMVKGMCAVKQDGKWGLYDAFRADWLLKPEYDAIGLDPYAELHAFNATVTKNGKTGLYDIRTQSFVLPMEYDEARIAPGSLVFTRQGQQRGAFYCNTESTVEAPYRYWVIPPGPYNAISHTKPMSGELLVDSLGKKGLWQNEHGSRKSVRLIPPQYNDIRWIDEQKGSTHYFFTDSVGKMGLWKCQKYVAGGTMLLPAAYDDLFLNNGSTTMLGVKQGAQTGLFDLNGGWKTRLDAQYAKQRIFSIFGSMLSIGYKPGIGFDINSDASGSLKTFEIPDKNRYDSFGLISGNMLAAYKGGLSNLYYLHFLRQGYTNVPTGSQLLAEGVDYCCLVYPPKKNQERTLIENQAIVYRSKGIVSWHTAGALGSEPQTLTKIPIAVEDVDDFFIKRPDSAFGKPLMLVVYKKKYGIVTTDGEVIVPIVHPAFTVINDYTIRFQSPIRGKFRMFNAIDAGILSRQSMDTEWGGLEWATVNGKKTGDIDSITKVNYSNVYKIDTGWYYIRNHQAKHTRVLFEGDITDRFLHDNARYEVIEKSSGQGLTRNRQMVFPTTMQSIYKTGDKLMITDKNGSRLELPLTALIESFDPVKGYTYHDPNKRCRKCNGAGGEKTVVKRTIPASTTYSTKEVLVSTPTYEKVWDPKTNSYKGVTSSKSSIKYETTAKTTKERTETSTVWVPCEPCNGKGKTPGNITYKLLNGAFRVE